MNNHFDSDYIEKHIQDQFILEHQTKTPLIPLEIIVEHVLTKNRKTHNQIKFTFYCHPKNNEKQVTQPNDKEIILSNYEKEMIVFAIRQYYLTTVFEDTNRLYIMEFMKPYFIAETVNIINIV